MSLQVPNIWQLQTKGDADALVEALRHPDAGTRRGSAAALRALGAWQAVPALQAALAVENDWQVHAAITAALQYLDHDIYIETLIKNKDVRGLSKMLNSTRPDDVITACRALGSVGDPVAVEPLIMVFRNPLLGSHIRLEAAEALLKLKNPPAVVTLLGALRRDDWQVRRNAAAVLGQLNATWAVEPLIKALEDLHPMVRRTAAAALRRIGAPEAIEAVVRYEQSRTPEEVEADAVEAAPAVPEEKPQPPPPAPKTATDSTRRALSDVIASIRSSLTTSSGQAGEGSPAGGPKGDTGPLPRPKPGTSPLTEASRKRGDTQPKSPFPQAPKKGKTDRLPDLPTEPPRQRTDLGGLPKTGRLPSLADALEAARRASTTRLTPPAGNDKPPTEPPPPDEEKRPSEQ